MGLYTMLLEGPVLALLISMTLRASSSPEYTFATALHIPSYLFLATIVAMFFGLTGAASEVLKDRALLKRESNAKVFVTGYVLAKALVLTDFRRAVRPVSLGGETPFWKSMKCS